MCSSDLRDAPGGVPEDPQAQMWWALWCFNDRLDRVLGSAAVLGLHVGNPDTFLRFPATTVIPAYGRRASTELLLFATAGISDLGRSTHRPATGGGRPGPAPIPSTATTAQGPGRCFRQREGAVVCTVLSTNRAAWRPTHRPPEVGVQAQLRSPPPPPPPRGQARASASVTELSCELF